MNAKVAAHKRSGSLAAVLSRIAAALFGGYVIAALASVAVLALPMSKPQAVLTGMLASFLIYAAAVVWVFAVRSAARAWTGLLVVAAPLALIIHVTTPEAFVQLADWLRGIPWR
jgi:hypothetical protein